MTDPGASEESWSVGPGRSDATEATRPLDDVLVVAVEQAVAAPLTTRALADLGARVIKVERPDGGDFARGYDEIVDGTSSAFLWLNRGKESIQLDLKDDAGIAALHRILARADVLVANLAPAALTRLGLGPALVHRHPQLIVCLISGYAADGPNADRLAYDALIQAETAVMSLTGTPESPAKVGASIGDIAAGTQAATGVVAALRHRDRTGEALPVQVSLFGALSEYVAHPLYYTMHGGVSPVRMGTEHPLIAPYGVVTTSDGEPILLAVQNQREWRRLCSDVLARNDLAEDARFATNSDRAANRADLNEQIGTSVGALTAAELTSRLDAAAIAWGRLTSIDSLAEHPELRAERRWVTTEVPGGRQVRTLRPAALPGDRIAEHAGVPALGADTAAVLAEFAAPPGAAGH